MCCGPLPNAAAPDKVLIAGVGRESVKATLEMAEAAAEYKFDAVLVRTPTYYAPQMSTAAVLHHFRSVADRSPLPVLLYHIPKFVPYDFPVEVVAELAQHPNIIGIKDSSGNVERIRAMVELTRSAPRRTVTVTPVFEAVTGRMLEPKPEAEGALVSLAGAWAPYPPWLRFRRPRPSRPAPRKSVSRCSAVPRARCSIRSRPAPAARSWPLPRARRKPARRSTWPGRTTIRKLAREKQERIAAASNRIAGQLGLNGVKAACDFNGYYGGRARAPLIPLTADQRAEVESLLANIRN